MDILKTLTTAIAPLIKRMFRNENIETRLFQKTDFSFIIESDIEPIKDISLTNDIKIIDYKLLCNFFKYPDIEYIIEKIYAPNQSDPLGFLDINKIYSEFEQLVIQYFKLEECKARNFSAKLFDILIEGCNETLTKLINDGEIQSQNALFNYRSFIQQYRKIQEIYKSLNDYKSIPDYLSRKVCSAKDYNSSTILFLSDDSESIFQAIEKNKYISLLSDGGMGKTTELKQIAYHYSQSNDYYSIFVPLNKYTSKNISEYFPNYWDLIPKNELLVILDGFDEIQSKNRLDAIREIEQFIDNYPDIHVIVSCRNNLYNIGTENISASLSGFKSYVLMDLEHDKIKGYVDNKLNSNSTEFFSSIERHNLYNLLKVPFYLIHLTDLFKKNHSLPTSKAEIFKALLDLRFQLDVSHYRTTKELDQDKNKIIENLEYIALSMECFSRNYIKDDEFKQLLPDTSSRELMKYCTVWKKQEKDIVTWQFEHNNFQEYLAGKKLSILPLEIIKKYIAFEPDYHKIIPSWINTISFIVSISNKRDLIQWIMDIQPELAVKFEPDKIEITERIRIFKEIFNNYKIKKIWINHDKFSYRELAEFGQSDEIVDFLLTEAETPSHYTTLSNAILLLSMMEIPINEKKRATQLLVKCALNLNGGKAETFQNQALYALTDLKLNSKEVVNEIVNKLRSSDNDQVRYGLYNFLYNSDYLDENIEVFFEGIKYVRFQSPFQNGKSRFVNEVVELVRGLERAKSPQAIRKIVTYFKENPNDLNDLHFSENISNVAENASNAYSKDHSLLDSIIDFFIFLVTEHLEEETKNFNSFFDKTSTRLQSFKKVFSQKNSTKDWLIILATLADTKCIEFLIQEYEKHNITDNDVWAFQSNLHWKNKDLYLNFNKLINEASGNKFIIPPQRDFETERKQRKQRDFNLLFNKQEFLKELKKIYDTEQKQDFKREELINIITHRWDNPYFSDIVIHSLREIVDEQTVSFEMAKQIINQWDWDWFCITKIFDYAGRDKEITISKEQQDWIIKWCYSNLNKVNFKTELVNKTNKEFSASWPAIYLWYFLRKFDIHYPKSTLLDLISFDWFDLFERDNLVGIEYLEMQLDYKDMKKRVFENLYEGIECNFILKNHLTYCRKHNIRDILQYCSDIIVDKNRDYDTRKLAVDITNEMLDTFSELEKILPKIQDEFKWTVVRELIDKNTNSCESYLLNVIDNGNEEDQLKAAEYLMELQNLKGIEFYVNYMSEHNEYPKYSDYIIEYSLRKLYSSESIPYLVDLLKISYRKDFVQGTFHSLHFDVLEAFSNVALRSESAFIEVKKNIEKFITDHQTDIKDVNFLYSNLENLEFKFYMSKNQNLNIDNVIEKLKEHGIN